MNIKLNPPTKPTFDIIGLAREEVVIILDALAFASSGADKYGKLHENFSKAWQRTPER